MRPSGLAYPEWMFQAPCRSVRELFFAEGQQNPWHRAEKAKAVCTRCPFRRECLEECYTATPVPVVTQGRNGKAEGGDRLDVVLRDASGEGVWAGTEPVDRKAVEHLPVPARIEILLRRTRLEQLNGSAPPRLVSCAGEILTTWRALGSPPEEPAETFRHVATAYGGSTITAARRRLGIVAERDASPDTGRVDRWRWRFSNVCI